MAGSDPCPVLSFLESSDDLFAEGRTYPPPTSPAAREAAKYDNPDPVWYAYDHGMMALQSARDHLEATDLILRVAQPSVAQWTAMRGLLEASSLACWLLDPAVGVHERVRRGLALQQKTLTVRMGNFRARVDRDGVELTESLLQRARKTALSLGFTSTRNRKGKRSRTRMPKISELAESESGSRALYQLSSMIAHCDIGIVAAIGFKMVEDADGRLWHERTSDPVQIKVMIAYGLRLYMKPLWMCVQQYGLDVGLAAEMMERVCRELNLPETDGFRFWRQDPRTFEDQAPTP